jgi:ArsR family transcriptional regulator, arsenate/arsenite/antimonite-responsive transcriptional repressor
MKNDRDLTYMASIYMALADKTRLRLLDLMRNGELCVGTITDALGESQPKISRHLAYLRNAGIVDARRDGKWIHYSIHWPADPGGSALIKAALQWVAGGSESPAETVAVQQSPRSTDQMLLPESVNAGTYAVPYVFEPDIAIDGSVGHNELDDFLL